MTDTSTDHAALLLEAVRLAQANRANGGRPFGAVIACEGRAVARAVNGIVQSHDPTSHAEMEAIREASRALRTPDLSGCVVYASGHPCPMCLAALVIGKVKAVYYAFDNADAEPYGMSSDATYRALRLTLERPPLPLIRLDVGVSADSVYGGG
ncbi:nucleoside deaminase [Cupriavidus sp. AU9028]|uniref:nucleoside deaminase n=1 Tax=Cupriavidus sp. AU9028 TaxID=2871157 RepID=UPI001C96C2FD|nr:nucleoside deaminase [Cupriavidus sp. AU9028]MBY4899200.1 nucleoside deaminase [Cupriavidus sp. AU9028]